jgi:hypothetical protein
VIYGMVQLGVVTVDPPGSGLPGIGGTGPSPVVHTPAGGGQPAVDDLGLSSPAGLTGSWNDPAPGSGGNGDRTARRRTSRGTR